MGKRIGEDSLEEIEETPTDTPATKEQPSKKYAYKVNSKKIIYKGKVYDADKNGIVYLPYPNLKGFNRA